MYFSSSSPLYSSSTLYFTLLPPRVVIPLYLSVTCTTTPSLSLGSLPDRVRSRFPLWVSPSLTSTLPQRVRVTISLSRSPTPVFSLSVGSLVSGTRLVPSCSSESPPPLLLFAYSCSLLSHTPLSVRGIQKHPLLGWESLLTNTLWDKYHQRTTRIAYGLPYLRLSYEHLGSSSALYSVMSPVAPIASALVSVMVLHLALR